jgi:hypothetical protein
MVGINKAVSTKRGSEIFFGSRLDTDLPDGPVCESDAGDPDDGGRMRMSGCARRDEAKALQRPLDFNIAQLGVVTRWTPVKNLTFSADVMWTDLDQKFTGSAILTPTAPKPTATYEYKDQDTVTFNVRAQRNF